MAAVASAASAAETLLHHSFLSAERTSYNVAADQELLGIRHCDGVGAVIGVEEVFKVGKRLSRVNVWVYMYS